VKKKREKTTRKGLKINNTVWQCRGEKEKRKNNPERVESE